jgi:hypothetical protein
MTAGARRWLRRVGGPPPASAPETGAVIELRLTLTDEHGAPPAPPGSDPLIGTGPDRRLADLSDEELLAASADRRVIDAIRGAPNARTSPPSARRTPYAAPPGGAQAHPAAPRSPYAPRHRRPGGAWRPPRRLPRATVAWRLSGLRTA